MSPNIVVGRSPILGPRAAGGGCITFIDDLYWNSSGSQDSDDFTITVGEGETLLIQAWWQPPQISDHNVNVIIDGDRIEPTILSANGNNDLTMIWQSAFWTRAAGLSAGAHTIGLTFEDDGSGVDPSPGGIIVWHVLEDCIGTQSRLGG